MHFQSVEGFFLQYIIGLGNYERNSKGRELGNARAAEMSNTIFCKKSGNENSKKKEKFIKPRKCQGQAEIWKAVLLLVLGLRFFSKIRSFNWLT